MSRRAWITRLFTAVAVITGSAGISEAGLLPASAAIESESGGYRWTYSVVLPTDMQLQSGSSFTIYDFAGYRAGSGVVAYAGLYNQYAQYWTLSTAQVDSSGLNPNDDPNIVNLTWTYDGPTIAAGQMGLGNFSAASEFWGIQSGVFTGSAVRSSDGQTDTNVAATRVPVESSGIGPVSLPEPGTLALAGLGLPLIGLGRLIRLRRFGALLCGRVL